MPDRFGFLDNLLGRQITRVGYAADLRSFCFAGADGEEWSLHVQCPWRLEKDGAIVTGRSDWWDTEDGSDPPDDWDPARGGSLQQAKLREVFCHTSAKVIENHTEAFAVTQVQTTLLGDIVLDMTGGYK